MYTWGIYLMKAEKNIDDKNEGKGSRKGGSGFPLGSYSANDKRQMRKQISILNGRIH